MRAEQKAATRQRILEAARGCFGELGFEPTTISAIAKAAGVSVGSVHAHFADKDTLLLSCFHQDIGVRVAQGWALAQGREGLLPRLLAPPEVLYGWYAQDPRLSRELVRRGLFPQGTMASAMRSQGMDFVGRIQAELVDAQGRAEIDPSLPSLAIAMGFFGDYLMVLIGALSGPAVDVQAALGQLERLTRLRVGLPADL